MPSQLKRSPRFVIPPQGRALIAVVMDTPLVIRSAGLRPLLQTMLDGPAELSSTILYPLLYISDFPSTRRFLYPDPPVRGPSALGVVLSDLVNVLDPVKSERDEMAAITEETRLRGNAKIIASMMSSWTGLLALCALSGGDIPPNNPLHPRIEEITFPGVRSLVDALRVKSNVIRDILLDLWFEVLNIRIGSWAQNFLAGRRLTGNFFSYPFLTVSLRSTISISFHYVLRSHHHRTRSSHKPLLTLQIPHPHRPHLFGPSRRPSLHSRNLHL